MKTETRINDHPPQSEPALSRRHAIGSLLRKTLLAGVLGVQILNTNSARAEEETLKCAVAKKYHTFLSDLTPPFEVPGGNTVTLKARLYYTKSPNSSTNGSVKWIPYTGKSVPVTLTVSWPDRSSSLQTVYTDPRTGWITATFKSIQVKSPCWPAWRAKFNGDIMTLLPAPAAGQTFRLLP